MGIFKILRAEDGRGNHFPEDSLVLQSKDDFQSLLEQSHHKPQLIFKHSTRCGISRIILDDFNRSVGQNDRISVSYIDVIAQRALSQHIASQLECTHESPQVLLVHKAQLVRHASHNAIASTAWEI